MTNIVQKYNTTKYVLYINTTSQYLSPSMDGHGAAIDVRNSMNTRVRTNVFNLGRIDVDDVPPRRHRSPLDRFSKYRPGMPLIIDSVIFDRGRMRGYGG